MEDGNPHLWGFAWSRVFDLGSHFTFTVSSSGYLVTWTFALRSPIC